MWCDVMAYILVQVGVACLRHIKTLETGFQLHYSCNYFLSPLPPLCVYFLKFLELFYCLIVLILLSILLGYVCFELLRFYYFV